MEMEVDKYSLLDGSKPTKKSFITRVIERFTLPEAVDDTGRRKEKFEKGLTVMLVISVIVITIGALINTLDSYPAVSSAVKNETLQTPTFIICSSDNTQPTSVLSIGVTVSGSNPPGPILSCGYYPEANISTCGNLIQFLNDQCLSIGGNFSNWRIENTMMPLISLSIQFVKPQASLLSELLFVVKLLHPSLLHVVLDPEAFKEFTLDVVRSGFIYSMGYTQELSDNVMRYPVTLLNLGPIPQDPLANTTNSVIYPFSFMLQLRSVITTVIKHQTPFDAVFSFVASIGGLASTINTVLSIFIGVVLTRLCFKDRSAFFDHKTRLAATYFVHQQEQEHRHDSHL